MRERVSILSRAADTTPVLECVGEVECGGSQLMLRFESANERVSVSGGDCFTHFQALLRVVKNASSSDAAAAAKRRRFCIDGRDVENQHMGGQWTARRPHIANFLPWQPGQ